MAAVAKHQHLGSLPAHGQDVLPGEQARLVIGMNQHTPTQAV